MGPGRNVALLCGHHKAIYEAELMKNRLPSREATELYIFDHTGPFLTEPVLRTETHGAGDLLLGRDNEQ
jgi:hypothetical protein